MDLKHLGEYGEFRSWSGQPRPWGPEKGWRVWFGGGVVAGLVDAIDEHIAAIDSKRRSGRAAAIGCVPWLTSDSVVERLANLGGCCIVLDKGRTARKTDRVTAAERLVGVGNPFPNVLLNLRTLAPAENGDAPVLGPFSREPVHDLGPVRVAGRSGNQSNKPLVHAKVLVLGELDWGEDDFGSEVEFFRGQSVWWGSANWTYMSAAHLEVGCWSDDSSLIEHATDFLGDLIAFSEPWDSSCVGPEPNLVEVQFDDDAMREAAAQYDDEEPFA